MSRVPWFPVGTATQIPGFHVELLASALLLLLVFLLFQRALRQRGALLSLKPQAPPPEAGAPVAIIVPARNEAANIAACLRSLAAQDYPPQRLHIIAIDDGSEDGTGGIMATLAKRHTGLKCLTSGPLQQGWTGKNQACWRGACAAPSETEWLCFIDADMRADPLLVASAVAAAPPGLALLSLAPRHRLLSFAERLMIPCGLYLLSFQQDLSRLQSSNDSETTVTGQFMLVHREAYDAVGGHAAVAGAICEDLELARLLKRAGHRVLLMDGSQLLSTRMYSGWSDLWPGFAKNVLEMFGGPVRALPTAAAAVIVSWTLLFLPILDYATCRSGSGEACVALGLALPTALAAAGFHFAGAVYFGAPVWYGLLFPLGYTIGGLIALDGLRRRLTRRVSWKGRVYS